MTYRVQYRANNRWHSIGLDCLDRLEVLATVAMVPTGASFRVLLVTP